MAHFYGEEAETMAADRTSFLKHLHFQGFIWDKTKPAEVGIPVVFHFRHDTAFRIDRIWIAVCAPMFLRKGQGKQGVVLALKDLAWQLYQNAMNFNTLVQDPELLYSSKNALWTAIHVAYKQLKEAPHCEHLRIQASCQLVSYEMYPDQCGPVGLDPRNNAAPAASPTHGVDGPERGQRGTPLTAEELAALGGRPLPPEGVNEEHTAGHQNSAHRPVVREATEDFNWGFAEREIEEEGDVQDEYREAVDLAEKEPGLEGETASEAGVRLCKAYERLHYLKGVQAAKQGMENHLRPLGPLIAWMACSSLNKYNTLRLMIMYEARKPFSFYDSASGQHIRTEPYNCVPLVAEKFSIRDPAVPELFRRGVRDVADRAENKRHEQEVDDFKEEILEFCEDRVLPRPEAIEFTMDKKHSRGNNFLLVFKSASEATLLRGLRGELGGCPVRFHAVVNRRKKLTLAGGLSVPNLPTVQEASSSVKQLTAHTLGYPIDKIMPAFHNCDQPGERVLLDKSMRVKGVPMDVSFEELSDWFTEVAAVTPTKVFKDHGGHNPGPSNLVTMVADFGRIGSTCEDSYGDVEKAMLAGSSENHLLRGEKVELYRLQRRTIGKGKSGHLFALPII
jgi:hypothetical protein